MNVAFFSAKPYDVSFLEAANKDHKHGLRFHAARLTPDSVSLTGGAQAICAFVNDQLDRPVIEALAANGVRIIALRCAGFNHVDLAAAKASGIEICRVPAYSPHAVAEHTMALILTLNRKTHRAWARVREGNFELDGLMGFDLYGKTAGVVGTGQIGSVLARILLGFGCDVVAHDPNPDPECQKIGVRYIDLLALLVVSDIVTLQCPLTPQTHHLIDDHAVASMKPGVMLINTSRGAVVDTNALIRGLKSGRIGSVGLDVYEEESQLFFEDRSDRIIPDDIFARLLTFPNVLITGHQGFFTSEAMTAIAETTLANITEFERTGASLHPVSEPPA